MKLSPFQLYLRTMMVGPGKMCSLSKEEAYVRIKKLTGVDFGDDCQAWRQWGEENPHISGIRVAKFAEEYNEGGGR